MDRWDEKTGHPVEVPLSHPNTFVIRVENDHASFQLNGVQVTEHYHGGSSPLNKAYSTIGLAVRGLHPGTTVRVRQLEVETDFK